MAAMTPEAVKVGVNQAALNQVEGSLADGQRLEVENGEIIIFEGNMTNLHMWLIQTLFRLLDPFVTTNRLGLVFVDGARYMLAGTPTDIERTRLPDLSFVRAGRIPPDFDWTNDFPFAPDFAVEIASPGQTNTHLLDRISRYLAAGTEEAWLVFPARQVVWQYRHDAEEPRFYGGDDVIDTTALFPGLALVTSALFAKPQL